MKAQHYKVLIALRDVKLVFSRIKDVFVLLRSGLISQGTCFPEKQRKNKMQRTCSLLWYLFRYGEILWQYNLYGLDVKPFKSMKEYIGNKELLWREFKFNVLYPKDDYTTILKDKKLFYLYLTSCGFKTPKVYAYSEKGKVYPVDWRSDNDKAVDFRETVPVEEIIKKEGRYFCKPTCGVCGRGIFVLTVSGSQVFINEKAYSHEEAEAFLESAFCDEYIIQEVLVQHPVMSSLHKQSVNTLRIVTAKNKQTKEIEFVTGFLRIGGGDSYADNMAGGGMAVGIDFESGYLKPYGYFFNNGKSERIEIHPALNVRFDSIKIPHLKEAIDTSIELHKRLGVLSLIGWDVAVTIDSIAFIEGNDNPEFSQSTHGPVRKTLEKYI